MSSPKNSWPNVGMDSSRTLRQLPSGRMSLPFFQKNDAVNCCLSQEFSVLWPAMCFPLTFLPIGVAVFTKL